MVNQYVFLERIGEGADSKVFLAKDTQTGALYAAKTLSTKKRNTINHIDTELKILRSASHQNIAKLKEVLHLKACSKVILIMEYADAGSLQSQIDSGRKFTDAELSSLFAQIIEGLMFLHSKQYIHGDIKPSNILVFSDGTAKLTDFGAGSSMDGPKSFVSSPAYQAPDIFDDDDDDDKEVDPIKGEVWSLGVSLYQTAFGVLPYSGDSVYEIVSAIHSSDLSIPSSASVELKDVLGKMLCVDPAQRASLEDVLRHKFFAERAKCSFPVAEKTSVEVTSFSAERADVCDEDYSFGCPQSRSLARIGSSLASSWLCA